ncbi:TorF family putative porin [Methylomonas fluvii]|uniref:Uncharacterized protein n=1 Tax=Methylomonas fluvii TaxID=1854564 RepID=A0ABR9DD68_9GAMM|nr:TorF family putative porin [Methylomonas fluvii]MBD9360801.1 hypothetical protein [Methylomonas fluvii]CAD6873664.1 hypothetical protein [Methylomonas fluvii]
MDSDKIFRKGVFAISIGIFGVSSVLTCAQAEWHGELTFLSDYLHRGYSKNRGTPLAQAHIDYQDAMGWFGGVGVSQVSFDDRRYKNHADVEIKPYLGWSLPLNRDWRTEFSVTGYLFDGKIFGKYADYAEFYTSLHYQDWLSGTVSVAPNAYRRDATVMNYELKYRRDILDNLQFSTGLGYYQANKLLDEDYFYWNAGVSWFITRNLALDLRYTDVHLDNHHEDTHHHEFYPRLQDNKFLISVTAGF